MNDRTTLEQAVTQHLRVLFKAVQAHSKAVEKECGLSSAKIWMLHEINKRPGIKVSNLANVLYIHASTCSNMLDKLENDGYIQRDRSRLDQRTVHLHLTDAGIGLLNRAPQPLQGKLGTALKNISEPSLVGLEKGLLELIDTMQAKGGDTELIPMP